MRGKVEGAIKGCLCDGITPAYAGKSLSEKVVSPLRRDHPRVCWEKRFSAVFHRATSGSPPHVRGKGLLYVLISEPFGITPAYAGERAAARLR